MRVTALAMAAAVGHNDAVVRGQQRGDGVPIRLAGIGRAMDENERSALGLIMAKDFVINLRAVNVKEGQDDLQVPSPVVESRGRD